MKVPRGNLEYFFLNAIMDNPSMLIARKGLKIGLTGFKLYNGEDCNGAVFERDV